jgi:hypothetical protein
MRAEIRKMNGGCRQKLVGTNKKKIDLFAREWAKNNKFIFMMPPSVIEYKRARGKELEF